MIASIHKLSAEYSPAKLISTEADPEAFIENSVNVINGDYCESATDLVIRPDLLVLQRFYNATDYITGAQVGGWRIFPERFLVIGQSDLNSKEYLLAFAGERSGGILPYSGNRNESLKIKTNNTFGMVNTYHEQVNGQTNHLNNLLHYRDITCELVLGDGSKRIYQKAENVPSSILGEELIPLMAAQVVEPEYFQLIQETLPSGNHLFFSYDDDGHLASIEMKNNPETKVVSWVHFTYEFQGDQATINIQTSDRKNLEYYFNVIEGAYQLTDVKGSHLIPVSYNYQGALTKKILPNGRFTEIAYENGRVKALKAPNALTGQQEVIHSFHYGEDYTDVYDAYRRGNITSARALYGKSVERSYNAFDQVVTETVKDGEGKYTLNYAYDKKGRLKTLSLPDLSQIVYSYNALFGKTLTRLSATGEILYTHTYDQYDSQGKLLAETLIGNGGEQLHTYDPNGQQTSVKNDFFQEEYVRDALGRVKEIKGDHSKDYSYNSLSQLTSETDKTIKNYCYDSLDNRLKTDDQELIYNALNQLTLHSKTEFTYDPQGNLLRKVLDGEETRFESNLLSQLISIENNDQTT